MAAMAVSSALAYEVAIIGGGIAGCAAARSLVSHNHNSSNKNVKVTIYEIGRGPGGRASTRRSRDITGMRINHGAPYSDISTPAGRVLMKALKLTEFAGRVGHLNSSTGVFDASSNSRDELIQYATGSNNEMANIASSLLTSADADCDMITTRFSCMVRGLSYDGRWQLQDKSGQSVGSADWLIVAGSGIAHPRWTTTFGGDPPLLAAATNNLNHDPILNDALKSIALQEASPVLAVFFYCTGAMAQEWLDLGFQVAELEENPILSKIIVQPNEDGGCSIVIHSTTSFAESNTGVYGSSSSAARVGDASSDSSREEIIISKLLQALSEIPGIPSVNNNGKCDYGPLLHRWGNAFPKGDPLPKSLTLCPSSQVGFCGDYTETDARMGSVEAALLSGTSIGDRIVAQLLKTQC